MIGWLGSGLALAGPWPALDGAPRVGGGEADVALIVAIDDYWAVPDVPGAEANGADWYDWLVKARGVPVAQVRWLRGKEATAEAIRTAAATLGGLAGPEGHAWLVFVGHGAAAPDGDPLLLGVDVQATAESLVTRSLRRSELEGLLGSGGAPLVMVLDSCFSGLTPDGVPLVAGLQPVVPAWAEGGATATILAAGAGHQAAGPLPAERRPAFSYLVLGALQGWGDLDEDGVVTADEAVSWSRATLDTTLVGRVQTPALLGVDRALAPSGGRSAPDLAAVVRARGALPPELPPPPPPVDLSGIDDLRVQTVLIRARAVEASPESTLTARVDAWCDAHRSLVDTPWEADAKASCEGWRARREGLSARRAAFFDGYQTLRDYLSLDQVDPEQKRAAIGDFASAWTDLAHNWYLRRTLDAAARVEQGREAKLPEVQSRVGDLDLDWEERHRAWRWALGTSGIDPVVPVWVGLAGETGGSLGVHGQAPVVALTAGGVDLAMLNVTGMLDGMVTVGFHLGLQPVVWRPSRRYPGELRGALVNPILGIGFRAGSGKGGEDFSWLEGYVANQAFFTNRFGIRTDLRVPVRATTGTLPPPTWVVGPVLNLGP